MRLKKLIKRFIFDRTNYRRVILGANTRLNVDTNRLQLRADSNGLYPLGANITAKTWVTFPQSVKQWLGFQVVDTQALVDNEPVTSCGYRLNDGTQDWWWDGTAWITDNVQWNTEAEIATNIATWPVTAQKIQVIINLVTTDAEQTPLIEMIKVLYASDIDFQDDLLNRSIVPALRNQIRPIADFPIVLAANTNSVSLGSLETPYNIAGIDGVYNHTDDPKHFADIFGSYDSSSKTVQLTQTVASGKTVWVRFYFEPEVAINTSQDYSEIDKVPQIILRDIALVNTVQLPQDDAVINKSTGAGTKVQAPLQGDLEITLLIITDKLRDQQFMADELKRFFGNNPVLFSKGMDEAYTLWLIDEYRKETVPSLDELSAGSLRFRIANALFFEKPAIDVYSVQRFHFSGDMNAVTE